MRRTLKQLISIWRKKKKSYTPIHDCDKAGCKLSSRKGWPVTIWFESKEAAQDAAAAIGPIVGEHDLNELDARPAIVQAFGLPSLALEVGLRETYIPLDRKTAWDR